MMPRYWTSAYWRVLVRRVVIAHYGWQCLDRVAPPHAQPSCSVKRESLSKGDESHAPDLDWICTLSQIGICETFNRLQMCMTEFTRPKPSPQAGVNIILFVDRMWLRRCCAGACLQQHSYLSWVYLFRFHTDGPCGINICWATLQFPSSIFTSGGIRFVVSRGVRKRHQTNSSRDDKK